jgi:hypothetical protein
MTSSGLVTIWSKNLGLVVRSCFTGDDPFFLALQSFTRKILFLSGEFFVSKKLRKLTSTIINFVM